MEHSFWNHLSKPIIGLSPMDGVTDFAFRAMTAQHGRPHVIFTEFTTAEGMFHAPDRILLDFEYSEIERPIVAQIYGHRPEDFYRATHVVCELGFDGIDINMGCPAKQVTQKNCGAKLITLPDLALEIIRATRAGIKDWAAGQTLEEIKAPKKMIRRVQQLNEKRVGLHSKPQRRLIPYSVKTRIGFDSIVIERWVETLLQENPAVISIHGRTLKQMYKGQADWTAIARAKQVARGSSTLILGNGDIQSLSQAYQLIEKTGIDGVLIGRSSIGNPWIFHPEMHSPQLHQRIEVALEHAHYFTTHRPTGDFRSMRKHLVGYLKNFPEAAAFRMKALQTTNVDELSKLLSGLSS